MSQANMQQVIITEPGGVDKLAYETVAVPTAKADEVLVKVHAFLALTAQTSCNAKACIQCLKA